MYLAQVHRIIVLKDFDMLIWTVSAQLSNLENDLGMLNGSFYLTIRANAILQKLVEPRGIEPLTSTMPL